MKDELKEIILMGLGAISLTGEKAVKLKDELFRKGEEVYKEGEIKNEELKRNIQEKIKENVTVEVYNESKEDLESLVGNMSKEEIKELEKLIKKAKAKENEDKKEEK